VWYKFLYFLIENVAIFKVTHASARFCLRICWGIDVLVYMAIGNWEQESRPVLIGYFYNHRSQVAKSIGLVGSNLWEWRLDTSQQRRKIGLYWSDRNVLLKAVTNSVECGRNTRRTSVCACCKLTELLNRLKSVKSVNGWMDRRTDWRTDGWLAAVILRFAEHIL